MTDLEDLLPTEPVLGVRAWEVSSETNWELLQGYADTAWTADGEFSRAACRAGTFDDANHPEPAPHKGCSCGLYAGHPFRSAARQHHLQYVFHEKLEAKLPRLP